MHDGAPQRFRPMTVERPKALLPLVNVPMIAYTLEWLVAAGIEEVRLPAVNQMQQERPAVSLITSCHCGCSGIRTDWPNILQIGLRTGTCSVDAGRCHRHADRDPVLVPTDPACCC